MSKPSKYLEALIKEFSRLPGIGHKSASRLAFHILKASDAEVENLSKAILELKKNIKSCKICGGISEGDHCSICMDETRNIEIICVVEEAKDILTIEKTAEYNGLYHVLGGVLSPLNGVGPEDLNLKSLMERNANNIVKEIILAMNPTIEGDATNLFLAKIIKPLGIRVMKIALGLPVGSNLEYADSATIASSLSGRVEIE